MQTMCNVWEMQVCVHCCRAVEEHTWVEEAIIDILANQQGAVAEKNTSTLSNTQTLDLPNNKHFFAINYPDEKSSAFSMGLMSLRERAAVAKGSPSKGM